jgi:hypothetical protein
MEAIKIVDPGEAVNFRIPCFTDIGIGQSHAESQLMLAQFDKQWEIAETLFLIFSAKVRAEAAAGVGDKTDITIISHGGYVQANQQELDQLRRIFDEKERRDTRARRQAYTRTSAFLRERAQARAATAVPEKPLSSEPSSSASDGQ